MRIILLALLIILILPLSFAAILEPATLRMALGFIVAIVIAMLALTYMLSKSFNSPQLEAWAKTEIRELIVAAVLFVIVTIIFFGTGDVTRIITGKSNHQTVARNFLEDTLELIEEGFRDSMRLFHYLTMRSGFSIFSNINDFYYAYATFSSSPYAGASVFFTPLQMASQGLTNAWFEYAGILMLLNFIIPASEILLPIAFMFRFIPFTRQIGNTLIALAVGGAVIFPFSIVLVSELHDLLDMPDPDVPASAFNSLGDFDFVIDAVAAICSLQPIRVMLGLNETFFSFLVCLPLLPFAWTGAYSICAGTPVGAPSGVVPLIYGIMQFMFRTGFALLFASRGYVGFGEPANWLDGQDLKNIVYPYLMEVNNFVLVAYIDALVIALVSYAGIKSLSAALGGEYMMPAINRLVR